MSDADRQPVRHVPASRGQRTISRSWPGTARGDDSAGPRGAPAVCARKGAPSSVREAAAGQRAAAVAVRRLQWAAVGRCRLRVVPARGQLVEPADPRGEHPGDGVARCTGGHDRQSADDLLRPAVRHGLQVELPSVHRQPRGARGSGGGAPTTPARSGPSETPTSAASTRTST